jgi:hypothetical protein
MVRTKRSAWAFRFGGARRKAHGLHTGCGERLTNRLTEQRVPIVKQEALAGQEAIEGIGELATALDHPRAVGLGRDAGNLDAASRAR